MQTDYIKSKFRLANKAIDIAYELERLEQQMDDMYKINTYLLRRYKGDLMKEFDIKEEQEISKEAMALMSIFNCETFERDAILDFVTTMQIANKIKEIMNNAMPDPWYCYGFGNIDKGE